MANERHTSSLHSFKNDTYKSLVEETTQHSVTVPHYPIQIEKGAETLDSLMELNNDIFYGYGQISPLIVTEEDIGTVQDNRHHSDEYHQLNVYNKDKIIHTTGNTRHLYVNEFKFKNKTTDQISNDSGTNISLKFETKRAKTIVSEKNTLVADSVSKKRRKRSPCMRIDESPLLPPCRICNARSSGFHYGAVTCEACKGFFRRTLKKKLVKFECTCTKMETSAWERRPFKSGCSACRYKRCLAIGMSRNATKIGRYTLERKTDNIKEVKYLEAISTRQKNLDFFDSTVVNSPDLLSSNSCLDPGFGTPGKCLLTDRKSSNAVSCLGVVTCSRTNQRMWPSLVTPLDSSTSIKDTDITFKEMERAVKSLVDAQRRSLEQDMRLSDGTIRQRQVEYAEQFKRRKDVFGHLPILSKDEYLDFYNSTGMELDDRKEEFKTSVNFFEKKISKLIEFVNSIPGFKSLTANDQASLIKASRVENLLVGHYRIVLRNINIDLQVATMPWGRETHFEELGKVIKQFIHRRRTLTEKIQQLGLTDQEHAVLRAVVTMYADRCPLENPELVEAVQLRLFNYLEHLLSTRPGGRCNMLYKIVNLTICLRNHTHWENNAAKELYVEWPLILNCEIVKNVVDKQKLNMMF